MNRDVRYMRHPGQNIFNFSFSMMYRIANCALTELPDSSSGGANAAIPNCPGSMPIMPPPTPVLAGIPAVYIKSHEKSKNQTSAIIAMKSGAR